VVFFVEFLYIEREKERERERKREREREKERERDSLFLPDILTNNIESEQKLIPLRTLEFR